MYSQILFVHEKISQSLDRGDYQCLQCTSTCQVRKISFEKQTNAFFLMYPNDFFKPHKNQFNMLLDLFSVLEGIAYNKSVSIFVRGRRMMKTVTNVCNAKRAETFWKCLLPTLDLHLPCLLVMTHIVLSKKRVCDYKKEQSSPFSEDIFPRITISHIGTCSTKGKKHSINGISVSIPIGWYS